MSVYRPTLTCPYLVLGRTVRCKQSSEVISWINLELLSLILFIDDGQTPNSSLVVNRGGG